MVDLEKILKDRINKIEIQIQKTAKERDESATPMESASDQSRQIANQLFNSLLEEKKEFELFLPKIKKFRNIYKVEKVGSNVSMNYLIVPDGLGGQMYEEVLLVGETSPIGMILSTKKGGEEFRFNSTNYVVVEVLENV